MSQPHAIITAYHETPDGNPHRVDVYPMRPDARGVPSHEVTLDGDVQRTFIPAEVIWYPSFGPRGGAGVWATRPASPGELLDAAIDVLTEHAADEHADGPIKNGSPA